MRVDNSIAINDYMTATMRSILRTMNMMISNMQRLDAQANVLGAGAFDTMRQEIAAAEVSLGQLRSNLLAADMAQQGAAGSAGAWGMKLAGIYSLVSMIRAVFGAIKQIMTEFVDGYSTANARLGLVNDGLQTQLELQNKVAESANRARASYQATANLVTSIGMTGAMGTTQDAVNFAEKVNKLLVIGGGGAQQNEAALLQLSQALASGRLQGDEFRSLRENAPALMATIAKGMGVPMGALKQMSTDGELTAEAIIKALENMGGEIDAQFAAMPVTFSQNLQIMKDTLGRWAADMAKDGALKKINDLFARLNVWLASDNGQAFLESISNGLYAIAYAIELVVNGFIWLSDMINALGPIGDMIFYGILAAGAVAAASALWGVVAPLGAIAIEFLTIYWPVFAVGAAITGLILLLNHFGVTAEDILTFVGGILGGLFAFTFNKVIFLYNILVSFSEFLVNVFIDPVYAVKKLFYDLTTNIADFFWNVINGIVDGLNWIISKTNDIAGTSFDTIERISYEAMKPPESDKDVVKFDRFDYLDYKDFAGKGADLATGFLKKVQDSDIASIGTGFMGKTSLDSVNQVGKVGKIDSDINIAKEDIKYLLDATTQKYVNQINLTVQTQAPVINTNGTIREEADLEKLAGNITEKINEQNVIAQTQ